MHTFRHHDCKWIEKVALCPMNWGGRRLAGVEESSTSLWMNKSIHGTKKSFTLVLQVVSYSAVRTFASNCFSACNVLRRRSSSPSTKPQSWKSQNAAAAVLNYWRFYCFLPICSICILINRYRPQCTFRFYKNFFSSHKVHRRRTLFFTRLLLIISLPESHEKQLRQIG